MRVLQIGAGSMGTRRMRDLSALERPGDPIEIRLLDERADRRERARQQFGAVAVGDLAEGLAFDPDVLIVSTPPHQHTEFVSAALDQGCSVFCEADIWPYGIDRVRRAVEQHPGLVAAPSATLRFHPVVREVARIVADEIGAVHAFGYLLSVDAAGWHPGEGVEYYARHRATAPAREMTAFELIALQQLFGPAARVSGLVLQRGSLDARSAEAGAEDTYALQYRTVDGAAGQLTVVMAAPQVARRGWIVGDRGTVHFDLLAGTVERSLPGVAEDDRVISEWSRLEEVYREEIGTFVAAVDGPTTWPYDYAESALVCATLAAAESSMRTGRAEQVYAGLAPGPLPDTDR